MDNRELLIKILEIEIEKEKINIINKEKENIRHKIESLCLIKKTNKLDIKLSISRLYDEHRNYHELIYKTINALGGTYCIESNEILYKIIEDSVRRESGADSEEKIINYFIVKNLTNSYQIWIHKDFELLKFYYRHFINKYPNQNKVIEKINEEVNELENKIIKLKIEKNKIDEKIVYIAKNGNHDQLAEINNKISKYNKINQIIGTGYFDSKLNIYIIIVFLVLKYVFFEELWFISFFSFIMIGITIRFLLNKQHKKEIFERQKIQNIFNGQTKEILEQSNQKRVLENDISKYMDYITSLKFFIPSNDPGRSL